MMEWSWNDAETEQHTMSFDCSGYVSHGCCGASMKRHERVNTLGQREIFLYECLECGQTLEPIGRYVWSDEERPKPFRPSRRKRPRKLRCPF